jgi:hypothetical protein
MCETTGKTLCTQWKRNRTRGKILRRGAETETKAPAAGKEAENTSAVSADNQRADRENGERESPA